MVALQINGKSYELNAADDMPLLWAIRDIVQLTGTKYGCGMAMCGACTVLVDGIAIRSCVTPVSTLKNKKITTIEGLEKEFAKLQEAWEVVNVPQCGYCQSGQLMSAAALLKEKPHPSDEEIDAAMHGNICRCGTYQRIKKAIQIASK
ncbi:MAG: (2Fe-2S)-binding protein [Saprospiraceae bacterium]